MAQRSKLMGVLSYRHLSSIKRSNEQGIELEKALLLQKISRLGMERIRHPELNEKELIAVLTKRGISYKAMIKHHEINEQFQLKACETFQKLGIKVKVVDRFNYTESDIEWSDAVFTLGGDGTYLLASNKIRDNVKPLIGFNSDPCRSEGYLCLPKYYSSNIKSALEKLLKGKFRWMFRSRIKVLMKGGSADDKLSELHHHNLSPEKITVDDKNWEMAEKSSERILPIMALNEVFLGENIAAKVSYFEVKVNGSSDCTRVKTSGILVCTGTGSTSWNLSTNRLNCDDVKELIKIYGEKTGITVCNDIALDVCEQFNNRFIFSPEDSRVGYTVRDLIFARVWPKPKGILPARGLVNKIEIKSRCLDAGLVIDGGVVFPFNDGSEATLETHPQCALRTVVLNAV